MAGSGAGGRGGRRRAGDRPASTEWPWRTAGRHVAPELRPPIVEQYRKGFRPAGRPHRVYRWCRDECRDEPRRPAGPGRRAVVRLARVGGGWTSAAPSWPSSGSWSRRSTRCGWCRSRARSGWSRSWRSVVDGGRRAPARRIATGAPADEPGGKLDQLEELLDRGVWAVATARGRAAAAGCAISWRRSTGCARTGRPTSCGSPACRTRWPRPTRPGPRWPRGPGAGRRRWARSRRPRRTPRPVGFDAVAVAVAGPGSCWTSRVCCCPTGTGGHRGTGPAGAHRRDRPGRGRVRRVDERSNRKTELFLISVPGGEADRRVRRSSTGCCCAGRASSPNRSPTCTPRCGCARRTRPASAAWPTRSPRRRSTACGRASRARRRPGGRHPAHRAAGARPCRPGSRRARPSGWSGSAS